MHSVTKSVLQCAVKYLFAGGPCNSLQPNGLWCILELKMPLETIIVLMSF